jgi:hypothetical protein
MGAETLRPKYTYDISLNFSWNGRNVSDKSCGENQNTFLVE